MAEWCDQWSASGAGPILFGHGSATGRKCSPEAGAAQALQTGCCKSARMSTTFTASQGLLLMIPNMYKIAGELLPFCMHVTARTLATHALSIFGDHSDVMACRQTGFALLSSGSVQEAQDLACVAHAATLESRVPFLHFFDGFRTSHEVAKIRVLVRRTIARDDGSIVRCSPSRPSATTAFRRTGPCIRGTAQNPDIFFQAREACNPYYDRTHPASCRRAMNRFGAIIRRTLTIGCSITRAIRRRRTR